MRRKRRPVAPTECQLDYLRAIITLTHLKGYPPSVREIGAYMGGRSSSTVAGGLERLKAHGLVRWQTDQSRTLTVTADGLRLLEADKSGEVA